MFCFIRVSTGVHPDSVLVESQSQRFQILSVPVEKIPRKVWIQKLCT